MSALGVKVDSHLTQKSLCFERACLPPIQQASVEFSQYYGVKSVYFPESGNSKSSLAQAPFFQSFVVHALYGQPNKHSLTSLSATLELTTHRQTKAKDS
jgi:hypothetical protein